MFGTVYMAEMASDIACLDSGGDEAASRGDIPNGCPGVDDRDAPQGAARELRVAPTGSQIVFIKVGTIGISRFNTVNESEHLSGWVSNRECWLGFECVEEIQAVGEITVSTGLHKAYHCISVAELIT